MQAANHPTPVEEWRTIEGFPNYQVSNRGRVKSLPRLIVDSWGRKTQYRGRMLRLIPRAGGYREVNLRAEGKPGHTRGLVHVLVIEAFVGPRPGPWTEWQCRHLNGDPSDNRVENLRWGSPAENGYDRVAHGNHFQALKTECVNGHPFTPENTRRDRNGHRQCVTCIRRRTREHMRGVYARRRAAKEALASAA